tara:strand:+ start:18447 stop:19475 length:1029 start_codon:yes stop_codon:yes gene_type:complete
MIKNILVLTAHDLAMAFMNKTLYLIIFIPCFVFISLTLVDQPDASLSQIKIGLIKDTAYPPHILLGIQSAAKSIDVTWLKNQEDGAALLKEHQIDGVLVANDQLAGSLALVVLKKESIQTLAIVENVAALQKIAEGKHISWISQINSLHEGGMQRITMPTWILMMVLLVGCIIIPAQVAEEKEKRLLLALLQTPIREVEWLMAKLMMGMILMISSVILLHVLSQVSPDKFFDYLAFIVAGSFCFSALGIFLGFLCRRQASARTLGVIVYLPLLMPSALSDVSQTLSSVMPFLPSYQLYFPLQSILLEGGTIASLYLEWASLLVIGSLMFYLAYLLMKRRWLM